MDEGSKKNGIGDNNGSSSSLEGIKNLEALSSLGKTAEKFKEEFYRKTILDDFVKQQNIVNEKNRKFQEEQLKKIEENYKKEIENKTADLEDKIENSKLSIIETLGLFIALFTFVSVDFQIFRSYRNPFTIGALTAILVGSIFLFIIVFDYFILQARKVRKVEINEDTKEFLEDKRASKARRILIFLSSVFILGGLFVFFIAPKELDDNNEQIKKEVLNLVQDDLNNQQKKMLEVNQQNSEAIKNANNAINELKNCIAKFGFTYKCFE